MIDKELSIELAKNKAEEYIIKKELEDNKKKLIEEIKNGMGEEIMNFQQINKPIKIKKPLSFKIKEFFKRINNTIS